MKNHKDVETWLHELLPSALVRITSASRLGRHALGEGIPGIHFIGYWVDSRTSLDAVARRKCVPMAGIESQSFSLYQHIVLMEYVT
jgi:hypothetical protein